MTEQSRCDFVEGIGGVFAVEARRVLESWLDRQLVGTEVLSLEVEQAAHVVPRRTRGRDLRSSSCLNAGHHDVADTDLRATAATKLARFKLPKDFVRVPHLVRSPAGKADYRWARDIATAATGKDDARP